LADRCDEVATAEKRVVSITQWVKNANRRCPPSGKIRQRLIEYLIERALPRRNDTLDIKKIRRGDAAGFTGVAFFG
jgi:hypothetical protein